MTENGTSLDAAALCPTALNWSSFALGDCSVERQEELIAHLEFCSRCQAQLEMVGECCDTVTDLLRFSGGASSKERIRILSDGERFGQYKICGPPIGSGGFSVVYKAEDCSNRGRIVALKILKLANRFPHGHERFELQAFSANRIAFEHPNIVQMCDAGSIDGRLFVVTEYCAGRSLGDWLKKNRCPMPPVHAARLVEQVAAAVDQLHAKGIVHCDIKPSNILLTPVGIKDSIAAGFRYTPKLADFGLAKLLGNTTDLGNSHVISGTPDYMAPEQIFGGTCSVGVDIFALGVVIFEIMTGRTPFEVRSRSTTLKQIQREKTLPSPEIPADLEFICLKCMQLNPSHRYDSAKALAGIFAVF